MLRLKLYTTSCIRGFLLDLLAKAIYIIDSSFTVYTPMTFHSLISLPCEKVYEKWRRSGVGDLVQWME